MNANRVVDYYPAKTEVIIFKLIIAQISLVKSVCKNLITAYLKCCILTRILLNY